MALIKLEPFQNVGANQKAVLSSMRVLGNTVEQIIFKLGGTFTKSQINLLRLRLNQKTVWEITGADLDKQQSYDGHPANASFLTMMFSSPRARSILGQLAGAIDTSFGVASFVIEADIGGATNPTLEAWAVVSPAQTKQGPEFAGVSRLIRAMLPTTVVISAAVNDLAYEINSGSVAGALMQRIYLHHANLSKFRVRRDGVDIYEEVTPALASYLADEYAHDPQSGLFVADFINDDNLSNALPSLRPDGRKANNAFLFTTSAGDTIRAYTSVLAPLEAL